MNKKPFYSVALGWLFVLAFFGFHYTHAQNAAPPVATPFTQTTAPQTSPTSQVTAPQTSPTSQVTAPQTSGSAGLLQNPLQAQNLVQLLVEVLSYVVYIGSIFLVLMLVFVGFQFVVARGNPEKLKVARSSLLWTVIGGLILLGAVAIAVVISNTVQSL